MSEKPPEERPTLPVDLPLPVNMTAQEDVPPRATPLGHAHYRPEEKRWVLSRSGRADEPRRTPLGAVHFSLRPDQMEDSEPVPLPKPSFARQAVPWIVAVGALGGMMWAARFWN